jgi:16S rRNA (cytosine967-C5)-methyltransferase
MQIETQHIQLAASDIVQQVLKGGRNLNQLLEEVLHTHSNWLPAQRAALQDLSYGTLRFYGQLQALLNLLLHKPLTDERVRYLLLVALYQLQYGKSAPHAVVDHAVRATRNLSPRISGLVNASLRNFLRNQQHLLEQVDLQVEGKYSYPQWWVDEVQAQYGDQCEAILETGNARPPMTLRINQQHGTAADYLALLKQHGIGAQAVEPDALCLDKPISVDKLPGFFTGLVSVQDAGAQYAARLLDVSNGMRVLDACAAPGGKTTHILECAKVELTALDKDTKRLQRVTENLQRLKLQAQLLTGDAAQPETWWDGKPFERILADVPCSASGVVRRHPDIKWLRRHADIATFAAQQLQILQSLWRLLAQDGKLLYATCSVFQQENQQVIATFLARCPDARQLQITLPENRQGQLMPNEQHDGFFYALLHKTT